ncbi:hypothetical protein [Streptomyces sp. WG-D5]
MPAPSTAPAPIYDRLVDEHGDVLAGAREAAQEAERTAEGVLDFGHAEAPQGAPAPSAPQGAQGPQAPQGSRPPQGQSAQVPPIAQAPGAPQAHQAPQHAQGAHGPQAGQGPLESQEPPFSGASPFDAPSQEG